MIDKLFLFIASYSVIVVHTYIQLHTRWAIQTVDVQRALEQYPQMRDFHGLPDSTLAFKYPHLHVVNVIASKLNTTIIGSPIQPGNGNATRFFQFIVALGKDEFSLYQTMSEYGLQLRLFFMSPQLSFKFSYCAIRQKYVDSVFLHSLIGKAVFPSAWIPLGVFLILTLFLLRKTVKISLISLLPTLIAQEAIYPRSVKRLLLYQLWVFCCIIFCQYFDAYLTSITTSPAPDVRIKNFVELSKLNYKLVHDLPLITPFLIKLVDGELNVANENVTKASGVRLQTLRSLQQLLPTTRHVANQEIMAKLLLDTERKLAIVTNSIAAARIIIATTAIINKAVRQGEKSMVNRRCYHGENSVIPTDYFMIFQGFQYNQAGDILQRIIDSGVYDRWNKEFVQITASPNVWKRNRIRARNSMEVFPLSFADNIPNIFVGWSILLSVAMNVYELR